MASQTGPLGHAESVSCHSCSTSSYQIATSATCIQGKQSIQPRFLISEPHPSVSHQKNCTKSVSLCSRVLIYHLLAINIVCSMNSANNSELIKQFPTIYVKIQEWKK